MEGTPPSSNAHVEEKRLREERVLKLGYFAMLSERYPLNTEVKECATPESAYLLALEREYMHIPPALQFEALQASIPESHRPRIKKIWEAVREKQARWKTVSKVLKTKWKYAPESGDTVADDVFSKTKMEVRGQLRQTAVVMISKEGVPADEDVELSQLNLWQMEERGLREQFYDTDKNYLVVLRLYYEMLLERPGDETEKGEAVLPEDHPERWNIVLRNRYARLIDATHQAISLAKAAHHNQPAKRMRKTREEPFIFHPLAVTLRFIQDVIPYIIEEKKLPMDFIKGIILTAVHDLAEDTELTIEDIIEFLRTRADKYDSSLDQVIESGFGRSREEIKRKQLDLLRPRVLDTIRLGLRMVTNDAPFTPQDQQFALKKSCLGRERTSEILGITEQGALEKVLRGLGIHGTGTPLHAIQEFPLRENDLEPKDRGKMDSLLLRIETFSRPGKEAPVSEKMLRNRRIGLCAKMGDKGHNNSQLTEQSPKIQRSSLRATVARLLAYAVLDYDSSKAPLYNALPRLIDETIMEYERFAQDAPDFIEELDVKYRDQLKQWQVTVQRYRPPELLRKTLDEWKSVPEETT